MPRCSQRSCAAVEGPALTNVTQAKCGMECHRADSKRARPWRSSGAETSDPRAPLSCWPLGQLISSTELCLALELFRMSLGLSSSSEFGLQLDLAKVAISPTSLVNGGPCLVEGSDSGLCTNFIYRFVLKMWPAWQQVCHVTHRL